MKKILFHFLIAAVIFGVGELATYFLVFADMDAASKTRTDEISKLKAENARTNGYRKQRDELYEKLGPTVERARELAIAMPEAVDSGYLFGQVQTTANQSNVRIDKKDDSHAKYVDGLNQSKIILQTSGTFMSQLGFLSNLPEGVKQVLVFPQVDIRSSDGLTTTMSLEGYTPIDQPNKEAAEALKKFSQKK